MQTKSNSNGWSQFESLSDPQGRQGQDHAFLSIILTAILAIIGGATGWEDIELSAQIEQDDSRGAVLSKFFTL